MRTILRRWLDKKPVDIVEHPLPDVDALNAAIPKPWPPGLNGQEEPPYAVHYVIYFCDPLSGALYTFVNKTYGSKLAYERLEEQIAVVRALRGANVVPIAASSAATCADSPGSSSLPAHSRIASLPRFENLLFGI